MQGLVLKKVRISADGEEVSILYDSFTDHGVTKDALFTSDDAPMEEFERELRGLRSTFRRVWGMPKGYGENAVVTQISLSKLGKSDRQQVVLTGQMDLESTNKAGVMNSPPMAEPEEGGSGNGCLTPAEWKRVEKVLAHAEAYLLGKVAQLTTEDEERARKSEQTDLVSEADEFTRKRLERDARAAVAPLVSKAFPFETFHGAAVSDNDIARALLDVFEGVPDYVDPEDGEHTKYPGVFRHTIDAETTEGVWCAVRTSAGVPRFWYDINPTRFDEAAQVATLMGPALFNAARSQIGMTDPDAPVAPEPNADESPDDFIARTKPIDTKKDDRPSVLRALVHDTVGEAKAVIPGWQHAAQNIMSDADIEQMLISSFALRGKDKNEYSFSQAIWSPSDSEKPNAYIEAFVVVSPLQVMLGKGPKKQTIHLAADLIEAARDVFHILPPEPVAEAPQEIPASPFTDDEDEALPWEEQASDDVEETAQASGDD